MSLKSAHLLECKISGKITRFPRASLRCCVDWQCANTCSSTWIDPHGHSRRSRGIRDHLPVSMRKLWDDKRILENDILYASGINEQSLEKYTECTSKLGFIVRYVTNLLLLEVAILWCSTRFAEPIWSGLLNTLSIHRDNLGSKVFAICRANMKGSCWFPVLALISLCNKWYCLCFTTAAKGDIPISTKHRSFAVVLRTPNKYFMAPMYILSTAWQLASIQLSQL